MIEVFVHSYTQDIDIGFYREASTHIMCAPDLARWATNEAFSKFRGRIVPDDDVTALVQALQLAEKTNDKVRVYDASRTVDKVRAVKHGILKTPAMLVAGKKCEGIEEIQKHLAQLYGSLTETK